jgi:hypothetical protein
MAAASEILFQAIQDSNYDPVWEDLVPPPGRSLRTWQEGYRNFPQVPGFTPSGMTIPPRRMKAEPSIPGRRTLAPKPPMLAQPGPSTGIGSPATQSPLVTIPTTESSQTGRRKRGRPSKKDAAARREQDRYERQAKQEQESQMSISEPSFLFSQGTQGPGGGPSSRTFAPIPESPSSQRYIQKRSTPRVPSNNGSSGNSGSSSGRRKRRQQSKNPITSGPPPSFALSSIEGRYNQPTASQQQYSHQRASSYFGGQQGPLPPPRTSSIYAASSQQYGQRQQSQPAQPAQQPQQQPPTSQQESRSGQSRSEGKSRLENLLNDQ